MSDINWGLIRSGSTFQDLICSLIRFEDHQARLYVRPGKDFAQDARSGDGLTVYQMKFHQNESASYAIADAKKEVKKITEYLEKPGKSQVIWQGVKKWVLVSNVAFNPANDLQWNKEVKPLFACLGLEASYWEKSEIETRLHKYPDLKQAYFCGETRVFLGIAEAYEQIKQFQGFNHPHALDASYQGRISELEQFKDFINDDNKKILVVHGAGGVGKTRFMLEGAITQALPEGWQVLWANVSTMNTNSSWFMGLIPERRTLVLIDEPDDETGLKTLIEQISGGRARTWKVAITVRSPNDLVLRYIQSTKIRPIVQELLLEPLEKGAAVAFCQELMEFDSLQKKTTDWKIQAATWIAQRYEYPVWMAMAIKILDGKGSLETMPQEVEGLASEYLEEIITLQKNTPHEHIRNLLQWLALFNTINREDASVMEWIKIKTGCKNLTQLHQYLDKLITSKVIFERGERNRLLQIKPDVLVDHILKSWLIYKPKHGNNRPTDAASEIIREIDTTLDKSAGISSIEKLLLRNIARFELIQHFFKNDINLLEELLSKWQEQLLKMNASRKLVHLGVLDEISFAHVSEVLKILKKILNSTSEPETISSIFGQRTITHDDVILALPWIIYRIAPYVQTDGEQKEILALLCDLVIKEHDIATRRPHGLPNDGKRAKSVLPRVITGSPNFLSSFEKPAFEKATELFNDIYYRGNISETQKIHLDTLVKPLLSVQQENTLFDGKTFTIQRWVITTNRPEWAIRDALRTKIKEILAERRLQPPHAVVLWKLLAHIHGEINQANYYEEFPAIQAEDLMLEVDDLHSYRSNNQESVTYPDTRFPGFRNVLMQDLQWIANLLRSHDVDIQELTAAQKIWDWHYQFDPVPELKKIATECEDFFRNNEFFTQYAPLMSWEGYDALGQWANETSTKLATSNNPQSIYDFVQNGIKILGNTDKVSRLFTVASNLGTKAQQSQPVHQFVEEALQLSTQTPEFQFATRICQGWVYITRQDNPSEVITLLEQLLEWANSSEKVVQIFQAVYEISWLINITEQEVAIVLEQQEKFLQANSAVDFISLLGGFFFSSLEKIRNTVETTLDQLDSKQLSSALGTFLQSLNYAIRSHVRNTELKVDPSLKNWILDQVLRLPDIDDLSRTDDNHLQDILQVFGKPDLEWLVNAVEQRIQMASNNSSNVRILPSQERLSRWILPISSEQTNDIFIKDLIAKLLSYINFYPSLGYMFPLYLVDIDPTGAITADLVVEKLKDPNVRESPSEILLWAKFAGYYSDSSPAWHKIAHEACSLGIEFDDRDKYSIFHALTNPEPKMWMRNRGEVAASFETAVEITKQKLETETDPVLIPFREWVLQLAQEELASEIERVKEEIDE